MKFYIPHRYSKTPLAAGQATGANTVEKITDKFFVLVGPAGIGKTSFVENWKANSQSEVYVITLRNLRAEEGTITDALAKAPASAKTILVDGLDEISSEASRRVICEQVKAHADKTTSKRFVITSRPNGYEADWLKETPVWHIAPFNDQQIEQFMRSWFREKYPQGALYERFLDQSEGFELFFSKASGSWQAHDDETKEKLVGFPNLLEAFGDLSFGDSYQEGDNPAFESAIARIFPECKVGFGAGQDDMFMIMVTPYRAEGKRKVTFDEDEWIQLANEQLAKNPNAKHIFSTPSLISEACKILEHALLQTKGTSLDILYKSLGLNRETATRAASYLLQLGIDSLSSTGNLMTTVTGLFWIGFWEKCTGSLPYEKQPVWIRDNFRRSDELQLGLEGYEPALGSDDKKFICQLSPLWQLAENVMVGRASGAPGPFFFTEQELRSAFGAEKEMADVFIQYAKETGTVIVDAGQGKFMFAHNSFAEYFAAVSRTLKKPEEKHRPSSLRYSVTLKEIGIYGHYPEFEDVFRNMVSLNWFQGSAITEIVKHFAEDGVYKAEVPTKEHERRVAQFKRLAKICRQELALGKGDALPHNFKGNIADAQERISQITNWEKIGTLNKRTIQ